MSTPTSPLRAHHRLLKTLASMVLKGKGYAPTPDDFDLVAKVFERAGGSWVSLYEGSSRHLNLLKKVLKIAADKGYLTKASKWGAG